MDATPSAADRRTIKVACPHDCPDTCAMLVEVEAGKAVRIRGNPAHPTTAGVLCTKVSHYLERTYAPDRLQTPLKRIGKKGEGRFAPISWAEALDTIAERFRSIAADNPLSILPYHYAGTMGVVQSKSVGQRFFNRLGASTLDETICAEAGSVGWKASYGAMVGMDPEAFAESKLILVWGANPVVSNLHLWRQMLAAKRNGAQIVCIDPLRTDTAKRAHRHLAPRPGTDAALALGMMHVLIAEDLLDHDYIAHHTLGFDALAERAAAWTPQRAADICGIDAADIVWLARLYGTTRPAAIRLNYGLQRTRGGGNAVRAIGCLPSLTGQWRHHAGGALLSCSGNFPLDTDALQRPDLRPSTANRRINMSALGEALQKADPPIRALYVFNANPAAVAPDSNAVCAGLAREDLFVVVHDLFQTDTADYADIVLPATSQLEHADVHRPYGHLYALASTPAIAPLGQAKPNDEVFRLLAAHMGFTEACFAQSADDIAEQAFSRTDPRTSGLDMTRLRQDGFQRLNLPTQFAPYANGGFATPSGKCEFAASVLAAQGFDPLPDFLPPHESALHAPALAARYPLTMLSTPVRNFLNSTFANLDRFRSEAGAPALEISVADAAERGIGNGDWVRVFNDRGDFFAQAQVGDATRHGVVNAPSIWWRKFSPGGRNCNSVTSQALTDLGGSATFYDCLVQVERCDGAPPPSIAFDSTVSEKGLG